MNDLDNYKASDPETAAGDFTQESMDTHRANKEIDTAGNPRAQQSVDISSAKLEKLSDDHDRGMDARSRKIDVAGIREIYI